MAAWQLRPLEGFPIGQVWFLHTLAIILIISPLYFTLYKRYPAAILLVLLLPVALAYLQLFYDVHTVFVISGHNLFKPIVHSFFFIGGFVFFSSGRLRSTWFLVPMTIGSVLLSVAIVFAFEVPVDYKFHTYSPDLYYLAGSTAAISGVLLGQHLLLDLCAKVPVIASALDFLFRYTFPIFLLHSFAIWVAERYLGLVSPQGNYVMYAIAKFSFVMALSCVLAVPFASTSNWLVAKCLRSEKKVAGVPT